MYQKYFKRLLDVILSAAALVVLCVPMALIALWIKLDSPGPVLFKQRRVGKDKVLFDILKFRTMRTDTPRDMPTHLLKNPEAFITRSGRFLRKTSLDELPQIWNIFVGEMSIVGPRPALWTQDDLMEIPVKAKLDGVYAANVTFAMDAKCFVRTITSVLGHAGVVEGGTGALNDRRSSEQKNAPND